MGTSAPSHSYPSKYSWDCRPDSLSTAESIFSSSSSQGVGKVQHELPRQTPSSGHVVSGLSIPGISQLLVDEQ